MHYNYSTAHAQLYLIHHSCDTESLHNLYCRLKGQTYMHVRENQGTRLLVHIQGRIQDFEMGVCTKGA